jgi:hypothetical protein
MFLLRMLTTKDLYKYTDAGEASSNPDPYKFVQFIGAHLPELRYWPLRL